MEQDITIYLAKADESLCTAESEFANGRYNSCAHRCYYACFQAAIAALLSEGVRPRGQWSHAFVQGQFVGVFINQRHLYETQLRRVLADNQHVREKADYRPDRAGQCHPSEPSASPHAYVCYRDPAERRCCLMSQERPIPLTPARPTVCLSFDPCCIT